MDISNLPHLFRFFFRLLLKDSLVLKNEEAQGVGGGGRGRGSRSKKSRLNLDSDARRGRFHRSNSVKSVGCEEQEKTWTVEWVIKPRGVEGATYQFRRSWDHHQVPTY